MLCTWEVESLDSIFIKVKETLCIFKEEQKSHFMQDPFLLVSSTSFPTWDIIPLTCPLSYHCLETIYYCKVVAFNKTLKVWSNENPSNHNPILKCMILHSIEFSPVHLLLLSSLKSITLYVHPWIPFPCSPLINVTVLKTINIQYGSFNTTLKNCCHH